MDTLSIALVIAGIVSVAVAILGKFRPDIVFKGMSYKIGGKELTIPEKQRWGFVVFLILGIMMFMLAVAVNIPQWQACQAEIIITIVMVMTAVMLLMFWKMVLSQNEKYRTIGLILTIIVSLALVALCVYFWRTGL